MNKQRKALDKHDRESWGHQSLVYPVFSRRENGISIGINTAPDKSCNFRCVYCEVDINKEKTLVFDLDEVELQLRNVLSSVVSEKLFDDLVFRDVPEPSRRVKMITLSGEPTSLINFDEVVSKIIELKLELGLNDTKITVITNATGLHRDSVRKGIEIMKEHNGELWVKLDAGTEDYYKSISRSRVRFEKILENIHEVAKSLPIIVQTCVMQLNGISPQIRSCISIQRELIR